MPPDVENPAPTHAAYRPRRDVAIAILLKVVLLAAVFALILGSPSRPAADAAATAAAIAPASRHVAPQ